MQWGIIGLLAVLLAVGLVQIGRQVADRRQLDRQVADGARRRTSDQASSDVMKVAVFPGP